MLQGIDIPWFFVISYAFASAISFFSASYCWSKDKEQTALTRYMYRVAGVGFLLLTTVEFMSGVPSIALYRAIPMLLSMLCVAWFVKALYSLHRYKQIRDRQR